VADRSLERDCLFQLNVLIWATLPQPRDSSITAVALDRGYNLYSIEQPLSAGLGERPALESAPTEIKPEPVADVVYHNSSEALYVLLECKPESFGTDSGRAPQSRGLIAAGGRITTRLQVPPGSGEVCYVVPSEETHVIAATLVELRKQLKESSIPVCEVGSIGLRLVEDGVFLGSPARPTTSALLPAAFFPEQRVIRVDPGQDPRPLYIVPWVPDAPESTDLRAFQEKLRSALLRSLGQARIGEVLTVAYDDLLDEVTNGIFRAWRNRSSLAGQIHPRIESMLAQLTRRDGRAKLLRHHAEFTLNSDLGRDEIMEMVRTSALPERQPGGIQQELFQEQPD
jgi:hypothetical protein